jgi:xanthine dehydrogenase large subunit
MLEVLKACESPPHDSAHLHVRGKSQFIDDMPRQKNEVLLGLVLSSEARARIKSINYEEARKLAGFVAIFLAADLKHNRWGSIICDQPLLAHDEVNYVGEVIAVLAFENLEALKRAQSLVSIDYEPLPALLTLSDAIMANSNFGPVQEIKRGDCDAAFKSAQHYLEGEIRLQGAEHFYLENQAAIALPEENGALKVYSSNQAPTECQHVIAKALGLSQAQVTVECKRLGGGFGGKETQGAPFALYASLAAHKLQRPARLLLSKDEDMLITGKRNPYLINYKLGFNSEGLIEALDCHFFADGGAYADLSPAILERAMMHADNAYYFPHIRIRGQVFKTNHHPHTAFRGFGGPKGVALSEHIMEEVAYFLKLDPLLVRKRNCYQARNLSTPYGQELKNNLLPELFSTLAKRCDYHARREALSLWNKDKNNHPRGISLTAVKFGISFTTRFLNQGTALIHIHRDGSVQLCSGAVEMGQGAHARIRSLVAESFGINENFVSIMATATDKNANSSPTAASSGTDINGSAALIACEKLKARLKALFLVLKERSFSDWPQNTAKFSSLEEIDVGEGCQDRDVIFLNNQVLHQDKSVTFQALVEAAYLSRICLSEMAFYKVAGLDFNKISKVGNAFLYFTQGVACSEVEINKFSGELKVLKSHILMDLGEPINYALDIGQITGAFIQGLGWVSSENLVYNQQGKLLSHSPSTYKIPSVHDSPREFVVELVKNTGNSVNLKGSKAVGEPPLMLAFSVWNAMKNALSDYRKSPRLLSLPVPASPETILRNLRPDLFELF